MNHTPHDVLHMAYRLCKQIIELDRDPTRKCYELDVLAQDARYIIHELDTYTNEQRNFLKVHWKTDANI
jgi:hypothetical protein